MIGLVLRSLVLVHLLALELIVTARLGGVAPDLSAVVLVWCALALRTRSALLVIVLLAVPRSLLLPGSLHAHAWLLCGVWLVLRSSCHYLFGERWFWQMLLAALAAAALALAQGLLFGDAHADPLGPALLAITLTAIVAPGLLLLLPLLGAGLRRREERPARTEAIS